MRECARLHVASIRLSGYIHSQAGVKMANQPVAIEDLTSLGIQSLVRGRHVYRTSQLRSSLLTYVKIKSSLECIYLPSIMVVATVYLFVRFVRNMMGIQSTL